MSLSDWAGSRKVSSTGRRPCRAWASLPPLRDVPHGGTMGTYTDSIISPASQTSAFAWFPVVSPVTLGDRCRCSIGVGDLSRAGTWPQIRQPINIWSTAIFPSGSIVRHLLSLPYIACQYRHLCHNTIGPLPQACAYPHDRFA
jgi:hypothetical protein